jgi:CubicO group peptidase (beta-lactamase class C family)
VNYRDPSAGLKGEGMRWFFRIGLIASALVFASAASAQSDRRATQITKGLEPKYYIAGMPRARHTLAEQMRHYRVPAVSIAVIDNYRVVWAHAAGLRDVASNAPASTTTLFKAASMSKPVAAAGFLHLVEERKLNLDADVNRCSVRGTCRPRRITPPSGSRCVAS